MWSSNSAYEAGAKLGRRVSDPWLSETELRRLVIQELGQEFRPRKTVAEARAESARGLLGLVVILAVLVIGLCALVLQPDLVPSIGQPLSDAVGSTLTTTAVQVIIGALVIAVIAAIVYVIRSNAKARASRTRVWQALAEHACQGALAAVTTRREREGRRAQAAADAEERRRRRDPAGALVAPPVHGTYAEVYPAPAPRTGEMTPTGAEELVAEWMRHLGEPSATTTAHSWDGGVDVAGHWYIAQVKHYSSNVGVKEVREFAGVVAADARRRNGAFFTSTGYTPGAVDFATSVGLPLFRYNAWQATLEAMNPPAEALRQRGFAAH